MKKVTIIQRVLPHYRIPLYRLMAKELEKSGIELQLVYGQEYPGTVPRTVPIKDRWAMRIENRYFSVVGRQLVWQPCLRQIRGSDLLIFEQANSMLVNYWLLLERRLGQRIRLAYWGHGRNMQSERGDGFSKKLKRVLIDAVDWWFAYTDLTAETVRAAGFPRERITVLNNAVDTAGLHVAIDAISEDELVALRKNLGLMNAPVGLFCGGMYGNKKLDFVLEACRQIRLRIPGFQMIFLGDGPEQAKIELAASENDWIKYPGPKFGADRAGYFRLAELFLMPGAIGLAVLDSFVAGLPMFTTDISNHGPEVAYLENGTNGFVTPFDVDSYSDAVCNYLLADPMDKAAVRARCRTSAERYTLGNMADRFVEGIEHCLAPKGVLPVH